MTPMTTPKPNAPEIPDMAERLKHIKADIAEHGFTGFEPELMQMLDSQSAEIDRLRARVKEFENGVSQLAKYFINGSLAQELLRALLTKQER